MAPARDGFRALTFFGNVFEVLGGLCLLGSLAVLFAPALVVGPVPWWAVVLPALGLALAGTFLLAFAYLLHGVRAIQLDAAALRACMEQAPGRGPA